MKSLLIVGQLIGICQDNQFMLKKEKQQNNIQDSFELTLTDSNLGNLGIDIAEIAIDSVLKDGLLKELPIIGTLTNLSKLGANIHDKLFLKKVLSFLNGLKDVSVENRKKMINDINESKKYRIKVGEKLLYIIDSCEDYEISELVSRVFKYYLENQISYEEFLKTSSVIKDMNKSDFDWFVKDKQSHYFDLNNVGDLMHTGLFELYYEQVDVVVEEETDRKTLLEGGKKYNTNVDGGMSVHLTRAGEIILEIFSSSYKKPKTVNI